MRIITVCVGSACHLKGSHEIIEYFKQAIKEAGLEKDVELKGCFCMDKCTEDGVNFLIDDEHYSASSADAARTIFEQEVLNQRA